MKSKILTCMCLFISFGLSAQLVNNGGTITVQDGAKLVVEGDIENNGDINVNGDGEIEVQRDFDSSGGNLTAVGTSTIRFTGTEDASFDPGTHTVTNVVVAKPGGGTVTVEDNTTVTGNLTFEEDDNYLAIQGNDLTLVNAGQLTSGVNALDADDNEFIITNGLGQVIAQGVDGSAHTFPVGFAAGQYNPITISNGSTSDVAVRTLENAYSDGPAATTPFTNNQADVNWEITGGSNLDVTVQWDTDDNLPGMDVTEVGLARWDGSKYDLTTADLVDAGASPYTVSRTGVEPGLFVVGADDVMTYVSVAPVAILGGAFNGTDMNDDLRSLTAFPTTDPYDVAPYNYTHVGRGASSPDITPAQLADLGANSIVDWMFLELRDDTDNTVVVATKSVFVQKDGDIVEADGSAVRFAGVADGDYHVVVKHRNHLGVMSNNAVSLSDVATTVNFSNGTTSAFGSNAMQSTSGVDVLWAGDVKLNGNVRFQGTDNDFTEIKDDILSQGGNFLNFLTYTYDDYNQFDVNLDGTIKFQGADNDADIIKDNILSHPGNFLNFLTFTIAEQLP